MIYVLMALLGLAGCAFALVRTKEKAGLLSVYLVAWGIVALVEWWAYGIFAVYRYSPGLSANWRHDSAWGVFLGEFTFLPSLNVVLAAFANLWVGTAAATALVTTMEILFVPWGIFIYQGWHLLWTPITFPFYFLSVGLYWRQVPRRGMTDPTLQAITRFCALAGVVTTMSLIIWASRVTETDVRLVATLEGNRSLMRIVVHGAGMLLGYWALIPPQWSERWGRIAMTIAGMIIVTDLARSLGLLYFVRPMSGVLDAAGIGLITIGVGLLTDWIFSLARVERGRRVPAWEPPET